MFERLIVSVGFDWKTLSKESVVVDVGGGNGSQSLTLARKFPDLRIIVQDREAYASRTAQFWTEQDMASVLESGKAKFQSTLFASLSARIDF